MCKEMDPNFEVRLTCSDNDNLGETVLDLLCTVNNDFGYFLCLDIV